MDSLVYFDCAASAKPDKAAVEKAAQASLELYANPGSVHNFGTRCERMVDAARTKILRTLIGAKAADFECVFDSGATEGNNIAILGAAKAQEHFSKRVITTTAEHDSVSKVFDSLEAQGWEVIRIRVSLNGDIDWPAFESALSKPTALVSALACSNQNGAILPLERMVALVRKLQPRCVFHTDATQAVTKMRADWGLYDLVTFSGHKIGGLRGSGALLKRAKVRLVPPEVGGGQEKGLRSGTLNTPGDIALAEAAEIGMKTYPERFSRVKKINEQIREGLSKMEDFVQILSPEESCIPFVLAFGLKKHKASTVVQYLSAKDICVSTTSACDSRLDEPNRILRSMGVEDRVADNPIRLSFMGREGDESEEDAARFLRALADCFKTVRPQ